MKYKQLIIGFTLGAVLFSSISIFAVDYIVNQNPFPILVNGAQKEVGALNVNNSTYIKLADAGEALGTKVAFNSEKKQIEIGETSSNPTSYKKGDFTVTLYDGVEYITILNYTDYLTNKKYRIGYTSEDKTIYLFKEGAQDKKLLNDIPYKSINGLSSIPYDYFINNIVPLTK